MHKPMLISLTTVLLLTGCAGFAPQLGVKNGQLTACPISPNCVNSQAKDALHAVHPITVADTPPVVKQRILHALGEMERVKVIVAHDDYIAAEASSQIFRFVDDVEFYFPATTSTGAVTAVQVRSASRLGLSDLGVNRKRVETIREQLKLEKSQ